MGHRGSVGPLARLRRVSQPGPHTVEPSRAERAEKGGTAYGMSG